MKTTLSEEMKEIVGAIIGNNKIMTPLITTVVMARVVFKDQPVTMAMFYQEMAEKLLDLPRSFAQTMFNMIGPDEAGRVMEEAKVVMLRNTKEMREAEALDDVGETDQAAELLRQMFQKRNTDGDITH